MSYDSRKKSLAEATTQDTQFELMLRSKIGDYCGERLIQTLRDNPTLWAGVISDGIGVNEAGRGLLPSSMIKLRDIAQNFWNVDTLFSLCPSRDAAEHLAAIFAAEDFGAMVDLNDGDEVDRTLGGEEDDAVILRAWWD